MTIYRTSDFWENFHYLVVGKEIGNVWAVTEDGKFREVRLLLHDGTEVGFVAPQGSRITIEIQHPAERGAEGN